MYDYQLITAVGGKMRNILHKVVGPREKKISKSSDKQVKEKYSLSYFFFSLCLCFLVGFNVLLTA